MNYYFTFGIGHPYSEQDFAGLLEKWGWSELVIGKDGQKNNE